MRPRESFGRADLDRWVGEGIITSAQREAILTELGGRSSASAPALVLPALDLATLLYYVGGVLVLIAYSVFLGLVWEDVAKGGRVAIAAASMAFFAAASLLLVRSERFRLPGELLTVVTVAITPLLMFAVLDAAGLVPEEPYYWQFDREWSAYYEARQDYVRDLQWVRLTMAAVSLIAAAFALWRVRSTFLAAAAVVGASWLAVECGQVLRGPTSDEFEWGTMEPILLAVVGAATVLIGYLLRGRTQRDYTTWLYVLGLGALIYGLLIRALDSDAPGWGVGFLAVAVLVLALSIPLQQRLFALVGAGSAYVYFGKLVFDVFEGSAAMALALAGIGFLIVASGMLYQRFGRRLFVVRE
jgi:hypothetical protein